MIPTRDGPQAPAVPTKSLATEPAYPNYEIIVVDNGSSGSSKPCSTLPIVHLMIRLHSGLAGRSTPEAQQRLQLAEAAWKCDLPPK